MIIKIRTHLGGGDILKSIDGNVYHIGNLKKVAHHCEHLDWIDSRGGVPSTFIGFMHRDGNFVNWLDKDDLHSLCVKKSSIVIRRGHEDDKE